MKLLLLCNPSANQRALANKLHKVAPLEAIGLVTLKPGKWRPTKWQRATGIACGIPFRRAWFGMLAHCGREFPEWPNVPISNHVGVNSSTVQDLVKQLGPDLVAVSGTDLLKQPLIDLVTASGGRIVNLHTGISPYVKGGPNCTNWCLACDQPQLIGNTVMWIDAGIDSGNIIATERTPLRQVRTLKDLHIAVMDHAHDLYCRAIARLGEGMPVPAVPQDELGEGRLFLTRHWTARQALRGWLNFRRLAPLSSAASGHRLVALDQPQR